MGNPDRPLFLILTVSNTAQSAAPTIVPKDFKNDRTQEGLIGAVQFVDIQTINEYSTKTSRYTMTFNTMGNLVEKVFYESDGTINWKIVFNYDAKGMKTHKNTLKGDGSLSEKEVYSYDSNGAMVKKEVYGSDGSFSEKEIYSYDSNGAMVKKEIYRSDNSISEKEVYIYDSQNRLTKREIYSGHDVLYETINYEYDSKSKLIKKTPFLTDEGNMIFGPYAPAQIRASQLNINLSNREYLYSYDSKGNVTKETDRSGNTVLSETVYAYKYDSKKNWISKTTTTSMLKGLSDSQSNGGKITTKRIVTYER